MSSKEIRRRRRERRSSRGTTAEFPGRPGATLPEPVLQPPRPAVTAAPPPAPGADAGPAWATSPRRDRVIQTVALISLAVSLYYIGWRLTTLNPDAWLFSLALWLAEAFGIVHLALFAFTVWSPVRRRRMPAPPGLSVDVFITTYNEPLDVLRKTVVAARSITYPHETWVLDDGCRDEVRALAQAAGVGYIPREDCAHAKAGNLNSALSLTRGDFFLQLDADHVPLPHILDRMLGYFADPKVAFVQSPQDFYNLDSVTHVIDDNGRRMWEEQRIFFDVIQPGKDRWNAAFFCGSCGVFRRAALEEIGGFSAETVIEDMETSILLHERGWKSAYVTESLAYGISPGSLLAYQVQRLRWARGSMQVLRKFRPLFRRALTWPQRLCYFDSCFGYLDGVQKLVLLAAPFVYMITGVLPIKTVDSEFLVRFFPYVFLQILAFELLSRGRGYLWLSERFSMIRFPIYTRALAAFFETGPLPFCVTPKGSGATPARAYAWQLALLFATPVALGWATIAQRYGWVDYHAQGWRSGAFLLNGAWMLWNAGFAWQVVRMARRLRQKNEYRFREDLPIRFRRLGAVGVEAAPGIGLTTELGALSINFLSAGEIPTGEEVRLRLPLSTGDRDVDAVVTARRKVQRGGFPLFEHLAEVKDPDLETQTAIELHCVHHAVPGFQKRYRRRADLFEDGRRFVRERRRQIRRVVRMPAQVRTLDGKQDGWIPAVLEELDAKGAQLIAERSFAPGTPLHFQVPGVDLEARGWVVRADAVETPLARRWIIGVNRAGSAPLAEAVAPPISATVETAAEIPGRGTPDAAAVTVSIDSPLAVEPSVEIVSLESSPLEVASVEVAPVDRGDDPLADLDDLLPRPPKGAWGRDDRDEERPRRRSALS